MTEEDELAAEFETQRPYLHAIAFRMLGSHADADDAVQEAWLRLARTGGGGIEDLRGWLTTVTGRICLDVLRRRGVRAEQPLEISVGMLPPEAAADSRIGPEEEALLADSVGLALYVVMDALTPAERVSFVLHDVFEVPFDAIAGILGRSTAATKMLASRARGRVRLGPPASAADAAAREVIDAFLAAVGRGDLAGLLAVLAPEVELRARRPEGTAVVRGAGEVARGATMAARRGPDTRAHPALIDGAPGVLITVGGRPVMVMAFTVADGAITAIRTLNDPDRLAQVVPSWVALQQARTYGILPVMKIGVGLDARLGLPFGQLRAAAQEAARLGFESLWTPAGGVPDAFHVCAAWSQDTSLRTGISVVPAARMWTPLGLAAQAATLAQLSSGRFVLGLGTGGYGPGFWTSVGLPDRPIAVMREYVTEVRGLLAGQQVTAGPVLARAGASPGAPGWPRSASLGLADPPPAPVYLAALGPQMLRLAGEVADGALLNWATPERIAVSREQVDAGAARAGREAGAVPMTMYIRVCVDDDVAAAREAFGAQVLGYAMDQPGTPQGAGYRGLFAQMGFDAELSELEDRRDRGAGMRELVAAASDQMLRAVGYYGPAGPAPAAFARLSAGLDEAIVRIVTARPGLEPVAAAMAALTPSLIRDA